MNEIEYMLENIDRLAKPEPKKAHYKINALSDNKVYKDPKGVVLIVSPWNYPVHLICLPLAGAIAGGNCVAIKPSEISYNTTKYIAENLPGYINRQAYCLILGGVKETTHLLTEKFDHIFFTGGGKVGKIIMKAAAEHLTPVTPVVIDSDADLYVAARRVLWGKLYNAGQTCVSPDYVMIHRENMDAFVNICRGILNERYGSDPQKSDSLPRIVNENRFNILTEAIDSLDPKLILAGGERDKKELYIAPTIVGPIAENNPHVMSDEIFGPILPIVPIDSFDEAIQIINSRDSPLVSYLFSENEARRKKFIETTASGSVLVNDTLMQVLESSLPFGGVGGSGMGCYHGEKSFYTFVHERSVMISSSGNENLMKVRYPPYNNDKKILFDLIAAPYESFTARLKNIYYSFGAAYRVFFPTKTEKTD